MRIARSHRIPQALPHEEVEVESTGASTPP